MIESNIDFTFSKNVRLCKFDDTYYYRKKFNSYYNSKGVDFLAETNDKIYFIEIKNCIGYESENVWRTKKNNVIYCQDKPTEESFDIEVTKKFSSTLSALMSISNYPENSSQVVECLRPFANAIINHKQIVIVLFLEGDFGSRTRSKKMIMKSIQDSIKSCCKWLYNCQVKVIDSNENENFIHANVLNDT